MTIEEAPTMTDEIELRPHKVHTKGARFEAIDPDAKGRPTGRRYIGPTHCPDCGLGLTSRGFDFVCPRLNADAKPKACHEGCIIACGLRPSDG
jgi:hypothetical protein